MCHGTELTRGEASNTMSQPKGNSDFSAAFMEKVYQNLMKSNQSIALATLNQPETKSDTGNSSQSQSPAAHSSQSQPQENISQLVNVSQSNSAKVAVGQSQARPQTVIGQSQARPQKSHTIKKSKSAVVISSADLIAPGSQSSDVLNILANAAAMQGNKSRDSKIMGYRKRQPKRPYSLLQDPYYKKWKLLKKHIKYMVFMNAAVCDDVVRQDERVAKAREERRFLLRKLLHYQSLAEGQSTIARSLSTSLMKSPAEDMLTGIKVKAKKKGVSGGEKRKPIKDILAMGMKSRPKKSRVAGGGKHIVPPIPLDSTGRPIFPLVIGDLTLHSIGEIVPDRPGFHTSNSIFPVGYCSTRIYASIHSPDRHCLYTCKLSDGGKGPMFEIVPEDGVDVFKSRFLSECHSLLLRALNMSRGTDVVETTGKGPEFFGLSHPIVQNLIQSCPGARKCNGYKWVKFEVNKQLAVNSMVSASDDATISYQAFKAKVSSMEKGSPSNLRSLLTVSMTDDVPVIQNA